MIPFLRQFAVHGALKFGGQFRVSFSVTSKESLPFLLLGRAPRAGLAHEIARLVGNVELLVGWPAHPLFRQAHFFRAERLAVRFARVLSVGTAIADVRFADDERGPRGLRLPGAKGGFHSHGVMAVHALDMPAVGGKA